jgi:hypothetical protein
MVANPAIQQPSSCPICGLNHDISQCKKEEARLNAEATKRGGKECEDRTDASSSGCFMCFALGLITFPKIFGPSISLINCCNTKKVI